jgi:hypothetical protein
MVLIMWGAARLVAPILETACMQRWQGAAMYCCMVLQRAAQGFAHAGEFRVDAALQCMGSQADDRDSVSDGCA